MKDQTNRREELLLAALYNELSESDKAEFETLLKDDSEFAESYRKLKQTTEVLSKREQTDPGESFWDSYWDSLEEKIQEESVPPTNIIKLPTWTYQAIAAAAILLLGIFIGRSFMVPVESNNPMAIIQPASIEDRTDAYLDKSKVLLLGLVNLEEGKDLAELDFNRYQNVSRNLLTEGDEIKEALQQPGKARLRQLVSDLEIILLQIANLDAQEDFTAIEMLQTGVERRGIMLKINLQEMQRSIQEKSKTTEIL